MIQPLPSESNPGKAPLLETCGLAIGYPKRGQGPLFSDLNLRLGEGSLTCLMGPNGAGKSTLIKTLTGLMPAMAGQVCLRGDPHLLKKPMLRARTFSLVLTESPSVGLLRVRELVAIGRHPYTGWTGVCSGLDCERVEWALEAVQASHLASRMVHELSDGERQRVMVARALAQDCPLIFLDEPTAYLDLPHRIELMHILRQLSHQCGLTLLMSTHDLELALQHADALWLLGNDGQCRCGSPEDLLLDGTIENTFGGNGLRFDRSRGVFQAPGEFRQRAAIEGDALAARWTTHALEKVGIATADAPEGHWDFLIRVNPGADGKGYRWQWEYRGMAQVDCHSVADLLHQIRQLR
jgi:iron complex transport system ATP-binding protein